MLYQNGKAKAVTLGSLGPSGVTSFNGRSGDVMPEEGDYTSEMVGAVPITRKINGKPLSSDVTLSASDIGVTVPDLSLYALKDNPDFTGSISLGRKSGTTVGSYSFAVGYNVEASGLRAHAEGYGTIASNGDTHAEGYATVASAAYSHTEGYQTNGHGERSHAEGSFTTAEGEASHVEGYATNANANYSHAEGSSTKTLGNASHAEGFSTITEGAYSHAEGQETNAYASYSHAEGYKTKSYGASSHAEGRNTFSQGTASHAEGYYTESTNNYSHASGKYNKAMAVGGAASNTTGDVFVVGNGTGDSSHSNALRLAYEGTLYLTKAYKSTGADYAEYFEWLDGNPTNEDRVGHFVTLEGTKIKIAQPGDYILGVVSGQPCVIGNADEDWLGRWEHDDFNRFVKEYLVHTDTEVFPPDNLPDEDFHRWLHENDIEERDGHYYQTITQVVDYPTPSWRHKANPNYDSSQPYVERQDRKEWDAIGMVGVLSVIDDGSCTVNGYAQLSQNGIATAAIEEIPRKTFRVIKRISNNIIKIILL